MKKSIMEVGFDWGELTDEALIEQEVIYHDIIDANLDEAEQGMLNQLLEINRELTLREGQ